MTPPERGYHDEETLRELYVDREMTTREIADHFGCSNGTISKWLNRHEIETRENWEAGVEAAAEANRVERVKLRTFDAESVDAYEYWAENVWEGDERTNKIVYVHRLLAVAEYGFDAVCDMDVHHDNGIPWDNRPENVVPVDKSDHGTYHTNQRWGNETEPLGASKKVEDDTAVVQATFDTIRERASGGAD